MVSIIRLAAVYSAVQKEAQTKKKKNSKYIGTGTG